MRRGGTKIKEDNEMSMEQMRAEVAALYPWDGWRTKVAKMPNGQILAIYSTRVLGGYTRKGGGRQ